MSLDGVLQNRGVSGCGVCPGLTGSGDGEEVPSGGPGSAAETEDGIEAYRQRGHIAETPHGHIKHNMGLRQLSVRGKAKAGAEWKFACAVCNLFKAITTGHLTTQALAALAT